jgi:hypothetical protein
MQDDPLGRSFTWPLLFLMGTPFAVVGSIAGWFFWARRSALGRRRAKGPSWTSLEGQD